MTIDPTKLKQFDLERALAGDKVVTRDGHNARIICTNFNRLEFSRLEHRLIVVVINNITGEERIIISHQNGMACPLMGEMGADLFMAPKLVERWINISRNVHTKRYQCSSELYTEKQEAIESHNPDYLIATLKIEFEE